MYLLLPKKSIIDHFSILLEEKKHSTTKGTPPPFCFKAVIICYLKWKILNKAYNF